MEKQVNFTKKCPICGENMEKNNRFCSNKCYEKNETKQLAGF